MIDFVVDTSLGLIKLLGLVFVIIMPLMIALEVSRGYGILERIVKRIAPAIEIVGFKKDSVFPLLAGILFGISYGAGVLIGETKKGRISGDQAFLVAVFLGLFHAVIEDTLLFVAQGAVWWILVLPRFLLAIVLTGIAARTIGRRPK